MIDLNKLPKGTVKFKIPIYDDMKFSLNEIKKHWSIRKKMVDAFHEEVNFMLEELQEKGKLTKFGRVDFLFRYFWKTRILDSTNTAFMSKSIEDAVVRFGQEKNEKDVIVKYGLVKTDTNECVRYSIQESVLMTKKERSVLEGDEVEVYIIPIE